MLKRIATALGLIGTVGSAHAALIGPLDPEWKDLRPYQWQARPVLVFAPDPADPDFRDQMARFEAAEAALRERDILVLTDASPEARGGLRAGLAVAGFEVVVVGKDGTIKRRQTRPLSLPELTELVDAMPMRQAETTP